MSLGDHLRELRRRLVISAIAIVIGAAIGWWHLRLDLRAARRRRFNDWQAERGAQSRQRELHRDDRRVLPPDQPGDLRRRHHRPPGLALPVWAFIVPGLTKKERRISLAFIGPRCRCSSPGAALAYVMLPKAARAAVGFTPRARPTSCRPTRYLSFVPGSSWPSGCAFLLPVFLVGAQRGRASCPPRRCSRPGGLRSSSSSCSRRSMTPTPDPFTMFFLAIPMVALFFVAVGIAALIDRRQAQGTSRDWRERPGRRGLAAVSLVGRS